MVYWRISYPRRHETLTLTAHTHTHIYAHITTASASSPPPPPLSPEDCTLRRRGRWSGWRGWNWSGPPLASRGAFCEMNLDRRLLTHTRGGCVRRGKKEDALTRLVALIHIHTQTRSEPRGSHTYTHTSSHTGKQPPTPFVATSASSSSPPPLPLPPPPRSGCRPGGCSKPLRPPRTRCVLVSSVCMRCMWMKGGEFLIRPHLQKWRQGGRASYIREHTHT